MNKKPSLVDMPSVFYPCWYAKLEDKDMPTRARWVIGVHTEDDKKEISVLLKDISAQNHENYDKIETLEFAIDLIDCYRTGGQGKVDLFVKKGVK